MTSLNFLTAHDGFTMYDLVAYDHRTTRPTAGTTPTVTITTGRGTAAGRATSAFPTP
jgi:pullulanase/glycogen debranching enzyme